MADYKYRALTKEGKIIKGQAQASNDQDLSLTLNKSNLELIAAHKKFKIEFYIKYLSNSNSNKQTSGTKDFEFFKKNYNRQPKISEFFSHLSDSLKSGLPLLNSLQIISASINDHKLQKQLEDTIVKLSNGHQISKAFQSLPEMRDPLFIALLQTCEQTGNLIATLALISSHIKWQHQFHKEINKAIRYPAFLFSLSCAVITFMMVYVVPEISRLLFNLGTTLPFSTRALIYISQLFYQHAITLLMLFTGIILVLKSANHYSSKFRFFLDRLKLSLPLYGKIFYKFATCRFLFNLESLINCGNPITQSVQISAQTLNNTYLIKLAKNSALKLESGQALSTALETLLPPICCQSLKIAEQNGTVLNILINIAKSSEKQAKEYTQTFLGMLEPTLTFIIGLILAWVVLAVLGPLYANLNALGQI